MVGIFWGIKNSHQLFPGLVERLNRKELICLALFKIAMSEKLKSAFSDRAYVVEFREFESGRDLDQLLGTSDCSVILFPSKFLSKFSERERLMKFRTQDVDLSKVSPDFLGLSFDRLNEIFFPVVYWTESTEKEGPDKKVAINLLLASALASSSITVKEVISDLISPKIQKILASENNLGTVLKDSEIDVPIKSSAIRQMSLKEVEIVKTEK